ncbi:glutamine--fructose-6-phosphate transaminase (isomerizing) [Neptunomonas qingdaonensis]|uniref:Glutamine--fructose-6-phosphate aminotransferase [isomerizing] n=1 Tax=Neptunomonas qingdaonensis TaxID=1045558 RepID=A0A1I2LM45_9GAMM|nr:glutamine--fructose-6-phosphate transaminase (isomerizing) [Neptunomonas qingdaonensis]SFF78151.1 glucosamine--fructose-6-phosphate aminotransferase (isomerizing) [Neptunomonas qingdaonensis]
MCGIVGATAERSVSGILLEGLRRLEYRGYDSAGMAVWDGKSIQRLRRAGKVQALADALEMQPLPGSAGIAHTRWATHGKPTEHNAHPHMSGSALAVVHNGIIENFEELKSELMTGGYHFSSQTDTEVIAHLLDRAIKAGADHLSAVKATVATLDGAFALGVMHEDNPGELIAARQGSPLVIGVGIGENFIASDQLALLPVTDRFMFLEEGDIAHLTRDEIIVWDMNGELVQREIVQYEHATSATEKGKFKHFMLKEIYEQPGVTLAAFQDRVQDALVNERAFGEHASAIFDQVKQIQIIACGTSYHAGMIAKYWMEGLAGIPCHVEVASEYRYRPVVIQEGTLFISISQSGETADTLAALRDVKQQILASLTICNVPGSSLVRESDLFLMTNAGPEIGVASTKAFTTQLVCLLLTTVVIGRRFKMTQAKERQIVESLMLLPSLIEQALAMDADIELMSQAFAEKHHSLFLGRGTLYPVAMEGALKLKEISYIHAEAYPAGELKHGPLALVDKDMPVVTIAPRNDMLDKLKANLQEVSARGGELFIFAGCTQKVQAGDGIHVLGMPEMPEILEPIVYTIPLQLLSYHVAVLKGTDVDQPRNLAKSVTVE